MAPTFVPTSSVVPACVSCNFKVYPFHRPVQNKCSELLADKRRYVQHRQRILNAQSTIHPQLNKTALRLHEDYVSSLMARNDVDKLINDVITKINRLFTIYNPDDRFNYKSQSLNAMKRKQDLEKIIQENDLIYRRLISQKTCYSNKQMKKDWKCHQELFARISKYPTDNKPKQLIQTKKVVLPPIKNRSVENRMKNESKALNDDHNIAKMQSSI